MTELDKDAAGNREVSTRLKVGIFLLPIVFAWFTLKGGYTKGARAISMSWLAASILIGILSSAQPQDQAKLVADAPQKIENSGATLDTNSEATLDTTADAAPPPEPVSALALVSSHRWSTWGSPCNGPLQATYTPEQGQIIFRNGQLLQDSNRPNITFEFTENSDGSFTFDQVTTDQSIPDVVVTVMRENVYAESQNKIRIERVTVSLSDEAMNDFSIKTANPNDNRELYKIEKKVVHEFMCS